MRELKFRGWTSRCFVYFDVREDNDFSFHDFYSCCETNTIEQYAGLKDKNGKEIYEGDIVGFKLTKRLYVVVYRKYDASFILENDEREETIHLSLDKDDFEVFGNIHENPELVAKEEQ